MRPQSSTCRHVGPFSLERPEETGGLAFSLLCLLVVGVAAASEVVATALAYGMAVPRMSQHFIWDSTRHAAVAPDEELQQRPTLPGPVDRVTQALKLPSLPDQSWHHVHDSLAVFVASYEFNLTEATRWSRDRLAERGVRVSRQAVGVVVRGAAYGGCPLYRQPSPRAEEIAEAFADNVLSRAEAADVDLSSEDIEMVRRWFGSLRPDDVETPVPTL